MLEAVDPAVIRVGYLSSIESRRKLQKQANSLVKFLRAPLEQHGVVDLVHGEYEVEALEVLRTYLTRPLPAQIDAPSPRGMLCSEIGRLTDVIGMSTRRIDVYSKLRSTFLEYLEKHAFGGR